MKLHDHHESFDEDDSVGDPQRIKLPFQCEQHIAHWEVQAFENDSQELTDGLGGSQYYFVLSVDLASVVLMERKKRRRREASVSFHLLRGAPVVMVLWLRTEE
jgi:hypothetical protein